MLQPHLNIVMMMPLPQLLDGLGRGRLEVVEKALSLHRRGKN